MYQVWNNLSQFHIHTKWLSLYIIQQDCQAGLWSVGRSPQTGVCGLCHPTHLHLLFLLFYAPSLEGNSLTCGLRLREKTVFIRSFLATTGDPKGPFLRLSCSVRLFFFPPQKKPQAEKRHSWVCSWCLTGHSSASGCC